MNKRVFGITVAVLLMIIVVVVGYMVSTSQGVQRSLEVSPTSPMEIPTPTLVVSQVVGSIEEIAGEGDINKVRVLRVNGTVIYVKETTEIVDPNNAALDPGVLTVQRTVVIEGMPVEGGIEAAKITVVDSGSVSPTNKPSSTPTTSPPSSYPTL